MAAPRGRSTWSLGARDPKRHTWSGRSCRVDAASRGFSTKHPLALVPLRRCAGLDSSASDPEFCTGVSVPGPCCVCPCSRCSLDQESSLSHSQVPPLWKASGEILEASWRGWFLPTLLLLAWKSSSRINTRLTIGWSGR